MSDKRRFALNLLMISLRPQQTRAHDKLKFVGLLRSLIIFKRFTVTFSRAGGFYIMEDRIARRFVKHRTKPKSRSSEPRLAVEWRRRRDSNPR